MKIHVLLFSSSLYIRISIDRDIILTDQLFPVMFLLVY